MRPKTEEFLNLLLWSAEILERPTLRNLTDSFESWVYRNGFVRQLSTVEKKSLVERVSNTSGDRLYRLTAKGRVHALGGRDPKERWARHWDGQWRLVLFDVPTDQNTQRDLLRRYLHKRGFGYLQNSVWITPDPLDQEQRILGGGKINVESLLLLEMRPCAGASDNDIVAGAWDFEHINHRYTCYLKVLKERPRGALQNGAMAEAWQRWAAVEREAWLDAVTNDPLLPERLLPSDYLGKTAWRRRVEVLRDAGKRLRTFRSS